MTRDHFKSLFNRLQKDIEFLVQVAQKVLVIDVTKSTDPTQSDNQWKTIGNHLANETEQAIKCIMDDPNTDRCHMVSKLLNMRESLHTQIFHGCLYRKLATWKDLNIFIGEFAGQVEVDTLNKLQELEETLQYLPTKMEYKPVQFEGSGSFDYSSGSQVNEAESSTILSNTVKHFLDMDQLIQKNFLMMKNNPDKINEFLANNPVHQTLRQQVQDTRIELAECQKKLKEQLQKNFTSEADNSSQMDLQAQHDKLQQQLTKANYDLANEKKKKEACELREKKVKAELKEANEKVTQLKTYTVPKLKSTAKEQRDLADKLQEIVRDSELLPQMFRKEAQFRIACKKEKDDAEAKMLSYQKEHDFLVNKVSDLENDLQRKERLSLLTQAAFGSIKDHLDTEK